VSLHDIEHGELINKLRIQQHRLDDEVIEQPSLYYKVAVAYAQAVSRRDALKDKIKRIEAKSNIQIRQALGSRSGTERVTESQISARIDRHPRVRRAKQAYLEAVREADELLALKEAYSQRSYMLRELCGLIVTDHYSSDAVRGPAQDRTADANRRAMSEKRKAIRKGLES
jgi:hypothetical protein